MPDMKHPRYINIIWTVIFLAVFLSPVVMLTVQSFAGQWSFPALLPETWSFRAWSFTAANASAIAGSILLSLSYSTAATILSLLLCLLPAAALVRGDLPRKGMVETLLMAPVMVPPVAFTLGIHHVFIKLGLADRWLGVVLILTLYSYPYMLRALMGGYEAIGENYAIAAGNLGAGRLQRLWDIELPLLMPAAVSGGSVVFLVAFSDYFLVFLVGGGVVSGYSGYLFPYLTSSDRPVAALLTLVFLALPILLFFLVEITVRAAYRRKGMENR